MSTKAATLPISTGSKAWPGVSSGTRAFQYRWLFAAACFLLLMSAAHICSNKQTASRPQQEQSQTLTSVPLVVTRQQQENKQQQQQQQQQQQAGQPVKRTIHASDLASLKRLDDMIQRNKLDTTNCRPRTFGSGWGGHELCDALIPQKPCTFYSFGINKDYSFDVAVADTWGCTGFAADPTIVHNSTLHKGVTFHNVAANSPGAASQSGWIVTTIPALRGWLKTERISVLKVDCEGCEYSLAQDVLHEEPGFFDRVDQMAMEIHWSKMWLSTTDDMQALGSLFDLLEEAGLKLMHVNLTPCGPLATSAGLLPELRQYMPNLFADGPRLYCHNYLFARVTQPTV